MRKFIVMLAYITVFLANTICWGGTVDNVVFTDKEFKMTQSLDLPNGIKMNIYSVNQLDSSVLVKDIDMLDANDISANTSIERIKSKIDENRMKNYADEEIILCLTNTNMDLNNSTSSNISLTKQIMWWNNTNSYNSYWYAIYTCHAADMFTYVLSGSYYIYRYDSDAYSWKYLWTLNSGGTGTWTTYGSSNSKGYAGIAASSSNKAHIVMHFYTVN
jgi:hypothetical protein